MGASDFIRKPNADIVKGRVDNVIKLKESTPMLAAVEHELTDFIPGRYFCIMQRDHEEQIRQCT